MIPIASTDPSEVGSDPPCQLALKDASIAAFAAGTEVGLPKTGWV